MPTYVQLTCLQRINQTKEVLLTQNRWDEAQTVGQHSALNHVELGKNLEGEQTQPNDVQRFEEKNDSEFRPRKAPDALEKPNPQRSD